MKRAVLPLTVLDCRCIGFDVPALPEQFHRQRRYSCPQDLGSQWCQILPEGGLARLGFDVERIPQEIVELAAVETCAARISRAAFGQSDLRRQEQ